LFNDQIKLKGKKNDPVQRGYSNSNSFGNNK
jgi:hypothetical protein